MATRKQAAAALGVEPQTLAEWFRKPAPWFPLSAVQTDTRGRAISWDVEAIRAARSGDSQSQRKSAGSAYQQIKAAREAEKLRQDQIATRRQLRDEALAEGNILPRDEMTLFAREAITRARDELLTLPESIAAIVPAAVKAEVMRAVADKIHHSLHMLADAFKEHA